MTKVENNRSKKHTKAKKATGLIRASLWFPADVEAEVKLMLATLVEEHRKPVGERRNLVPCTFRDTKTGRMVYLEK